MDFARASATAADTMNINALRDHAAECAQDGVRTSEALRCRPAYAREPLNSFASSLTSTGFARWRLKPASLAFALASEPS